MTPSAPQKSLSGVITSEDRLVEKPGLELLVELGWTHSDLFGEEPGAGNPTGRLSFRELVLPTRLRAALRKLNPSLPDEALQLAELALTADRSAMLPVAANREVYRLLRDGIPVQVRQPDGSLKDERVAVIDWTNPAANDFFLGSSGLDREQSLQASAGRSRLRQRHPALAHRVEGPHRTRSGSLRGQPSGLPRHNPATVRLQRLRHSLERAAKR